MPQAFVERAVADFAAAYSTACAALGDRLGLYRAMAGAGAVTPGELAERTGVPEAYLRAWLANQAAGGYVDYDREAGRFTLNDEQAQVLADENSPVFLLGITEGIASVYRDLEAIAAAYASRSGLGWHEHSPGLFTGTERLFRPGYAAYLESEWIPALDGVEDRLRAGASVVDIGCGHGVSTVVMAQAYPRSTFAGYDYHEASVEAARRNAAEAGVDDRVSFAVAAARDFPGRDFDLACLFDCLHDMGDPVGALAHIRETLTENGTVLLVEPQAGEELADNLTPVGRLFYAAAAVVCVPNAVSQDGGAPLHTQSSEQDYRAVARAAGFNRFRRAAETPFNRIFELRP